MARKPKASPYDDSAGRGTGDYLAPKTNTAIEPLANPSSKSAPMKVGHKALESTPPDSSLFGAVLATFFCFAPLGILAILYALRVRPRWKRGDEAGAKHAAEMAEKLTFAAVGLFVIVFVCGVIGYGIYWFFGPRAKH
jgi:hypothetical protein